ncbi:MAG: branched-chain amino acid ABC transporter substrate-binding protein [Candidatus Dormiibacterota bacterium]
MKLRYLVATAVVPSMFLAACGGGTTSSSASKGTIEIASSFPLQGGDASATIPMLDGVTYAVDTTKSIDGFTLKLVSYDDSVSGLGNADKEAENVNEMIDNPDVLGMIGPYYSSYGDIDIPLTNRAGLAEISPSNTDECLTVPYSWCDPTEQQLRPTGVNNYFRLTASDLFQGPAMADYAYNVLGYRTVAAFSNGESSPESMKDHFITEFEKDGGSVPVNQDFDWQTLTDFTPLILRAKAAGAQAVYMGGESSTKSCQFRAQMQGILNVPFMGDDGMTNQQCINDAGTNADGMTNTVPIADPFNIASSQSLIKAYEKAYPIANDLASYTFPAYDCTKILIAAIGRAIVDAGGKMPSRAQVVTEMAGTKNFKGVTGTYTFNQYGDATHPYVSIYQTEGTPAKFTFVKQVAIDPNSIPLVGTP